MTRKLTSRSTLQTHGPGSPPSGRRRLDVWCVAALLLAATVVVYLSSFRGGFIFDDEPNILKNPNIRQLWPITRAMSAPPQSGVAGRPIVALSLAVNYALGGLDPWGYHFFNLTAHVLGGLLLFGLVRRTLSGPRLAERYGARATRLAAIIAMLWLVHPLHTESVTYIITRTEVMFGVFCLSTLYCVVRAPHSRWRGAWHVGAVLSCLLGMGCKEVMVVVPALVLLYDRVFQSASFSAAWRRSRGLYAGLAASWVLLAILNASSPRSASVGFSQGVTAFDYAKNQCLAIISYLRLAFWPHPLCFDYGFPRALSLLRVWPQGLALVALIAATIAALRYRPALGFCGASFFIILAPTSSFVPITTEVAAERRMYLPLAALAAVVVLVAYHLVARAAHASRERQRLSAVFSIASLVAVVVGLGWTTHRRNLMYADPVGLWRQTMAADPTNARAYFGLGLAMLAEGDSAEALRLYETALKIKPDYVEVLYNLGNLLLKGQQYEDATQRYTAALAINPDFGKARLNLGIALVNLGRAAEAILQYKMLLQSEPDSPDLEGNLAVALAYAGRIDEAIGHMRKVVDLAPADCTARSNLASLLLQQHRVDEAIVQLSEVVRLRPQDLPARRALAQALAETGRLAQAADQLREIVRLAPNDAPARAALDEVTKRLNPGS